MGCDAISGKAAPTMMCGDVEISPAGPGGAVERELRGALSQVSPISGVTPAQAGRSPIRRLSAALWYRAGMEPKLSWWAVLAAFFVLMVMAASIGVTLGLLVSMPPPL